LALLTLKQDAQPGTRQLAAVLLKRVLTERMPASIDPAEVGDIRELLLRGLSDPSSKIRTAVVSPHLIASSWLYESRLDDAAL
jgi:hypothetical protein